MSPESDAASAPLAARPRFAGSSGRRTRFHGTPRGGRALRIGASGASGAGFRRGSPVTAAAARSDTTSRPDGTGAPRD
jgi:hypothetical protein